MPPARATVASAPDAGTDSVDDHGLDGRHPAASIVAVMPDLRTHRGRGRNDMSLEGMAGMRADIDDVSALLGSLDDSEWDAPSAAAGWTVKDVATHLPDLMDILVTGVQGTLHTDLGIERLNDERVAAKSSWVPAQILDDLARQSAVALPVFEQLQADPYASTEVLLLDLGIYPENRIPDMFAFDFYTHLRWDILARSGRCATTYPHSTRCGLSRPLAGYLPGSRRCRAASGTA
jgi:uncharacterized protein (TIGR03083 family)